MKQRIRAEKVETIKKRIKTSENKRISSKKKKGKVMIWKVFQS